MFADPAALALARGRAYDLLGATVRHGLLPARLPHLRAVAWLAPHLPLDLDPDREAARHQDLFGRQLLPWQSVWTGPEGRLEDTPAAALRRHLAAAGLASEAELAGEVDHLGAALRWLARATEVELGARQEGDAAQVAAAQALQRALLDDHLLCWLPGLLIAAEASEAGWIQALLALALETAREHRLSLGGPATAWSLPGAPPDLDAPDTDLRAIAGWLCRPATAGLLLSHDALRALGRAAGTPGGFGDRRLILENQLHTAAHLGRVPELVAALSAELDRWLGRYAALAAPGLEAALAPWITRAEATRAALPRLAEAARAP